MAAAFEFVELLNGADFTVVPGTLPKGGVGWPWLILSQSGIEKVTDWFVKQPADGQEVAICQPQS